MMVLIQHAYSVILDVVPALIPQIYKNVIPVVILQEKIKIVLVNKGL